MSKLTVDSFQKQTGLVVLDNDQNGVVDKHDKIFEPTDKGLKQLELKEVEKRFPNLVSNATQEKATDSIEPSKKSAVKATTRVQERLDKENFPYQSALVTGASSGLGKGLTQWLAKNGTTVYAVGNNQQALDALVKECESLPGKIKPLLLDVSDTKAVMEKVGGIDKSSGGLDLVIACAGVPGPGSAKDINPDQLEKVIGINLNGAVATLSAALPGMVERNRGQIVGISSLTTRIAVKNAALYDTSKSGLNAFLKSCRADLFGTGVTVTCIQPGFVATNFTAGRSWKMPFLLQPDQATEIISKAILHKKETYAFPKPLVMLANLGRLLPAKLVNRLTSRGR